VTPACTEARKVLMKTPLAISRASAGKTNYLISPWSFLGKPLQGL
jgi:hypothetical protein